jgi:hypothetical protein
MGKLTAASLAVALAFGLDLDLEAVKLGNGHFC